MTDSIRYQLHELLTKHYDSEELRTLCFYLGEYLSDFSYDALQGDGFLAKVREFILLFERRKMIRSVLAVIEQQKPELVQEVSRIRQLLPQEDWHRSDLFDFQEGLNELKSALESSRPADEYLNLLVLEARLLDNLREEQTFGPNDTLRSDQARIVGTLNRLAYEKLDRSFVQLCRSDEFRTDFDEYFGAIRSQISDVDEKAELAIFEFRLLRAVVDEQRFGITSDTQADKRRILYSLNQWTQAKLDKEFLPLEDSLQQ